MPDSVVQIPSRPAPATLRKRLETFRWRAEMAEVLLVVAVVAGAAVTAQDQPVPSAADAERASPHRSDVAERFHALAREWRTTSHPAAEVHDLVTHPAYRSIVAMGTDVVPFILKELQRRKWPEHWFSALHEITGADPIAESDEGDLPAMARAWVVWGRAKSIIA